ncbi:hypothetical protein V2A60_000694 [Cordyceps javanica]
MFGALKTALAIAAAAAAVVVNAAPTHGDLPRPHPQCRPSSYHCVGDNIMTCNGSNQWVVSATCAPGCCSDDGAYVAWCSC